MEEGSTHPDSPTADSPTADLQFACVPSLFCVCVCVCVCCVCVCVCVCVDLGHLGPRCAYSIANIWVEGEKSASHRDAFVSG